MDYQAPAQAPAQAVGVAKGVGVGRRFLAILIDGILFGIVFGIINAVLGSKEVVISSGIGVVIYFLYFIITEATLGATVGKLALGLRVVKVDGSPISWVDSLIRNILRIIDVLPTAYLVAAILVWTTKSNQRLGDLAAHTLVVRKGQNPV
jgi:uncharacterized RDD family membrane protein YckC